ncbi:glycosyltransferase family 4 protein [Paracoccus aerius]
MAPLGFQLQACRGDDGDGLVRVRHRPASAYRGPGRTLRKLILGCWANMLGRPYVLHLHDYDYAADLDRRPAWQQRAIGRLFTRAAQVIVLGQRDAATVTCRLGVDPSRVVVLRNCVPDPGRRQRQGSAGTRILFLGRLSARKGVPELVEALARPELRDKPWTAVLAGDGEVDETRRALARLGLSDKVRLPGWVDAAAAQKLRDESDILVLPSHAEGFAMSVLEGLAQGMAVVTTRVGAHDEVLEDEVNCLLVPPGDVTALAAALRRLIDDEGLRSRLGQAARRLYETDFSMTRYLHRLEALDAKAIPQPPCSGSCHDRDRQAALPQPVEMGAPSQMPEADGTDVWLAAWRMIRRRLWLIASLVTLICLLALPAILALPKLYHAESRVMVTASPPLPWPPRTAAPSRRPRWIPRSSGCFPTR